MSDCSQMPSQLLLLPCRCLCSAEPLVVLQRDGLLAAVRPGFEGWQVLLSSILSAEGGPCRSVGYLIGSLVLQVGSVCDVCTAIGRVGDLLPSNIFAAPVLLDLCPQCQVSCAVLTASGPWDRSATSPLSRCVALPLLAWISKEDSSRPRFTSQSLSHGYANSDAPRSSTSIRIAITRIPWL